MASLQKIRNHGGLLIAIVGIAMLAFILGDFLTSGSSWFNRGKDDVGSVAGNTISYSEMEIARHQLENYFQYYGVQNEDMPEVLWSSFVTYYSMEDQAEKIGMGISEEEADWLAAQGQGLPIFFVHGQYLQRKYMDLLGSMLKANSLEAEFAFNNNQNGVNVEYVKIPYSAIDESLVKVSDSDVKAIYEEHKEEFKLKEPIRTIQYVAINVLPTDADREKKVETMNKFRKQFSELKDVKGYLRDHSEAPFDTINTYTMESVPAQFLDFAFAPEAEVGACSEVWQEGNAVAIARIMDINEEEGEVALAILKETTTPSDKTLKEQRRKCQDFVNKNNTLSAFLAAADKEGYFAMSTDLQPMTKQVSSFAGTREIVRWAFNDAEAGMVSEKVYEAGNHQLIMVALADVIEGEYAPFEKVSNQLRPMAVNKAKAAYIQKQLQNEKTLEGAAEKFESAISDHVESVALGDMLIGSSYEPEVIGSIFALSENQVSAPIEGNDGVYLVKRGLVTGIAEEFTEEIKANGKKQLTQAYWERLLNNAGEYLLDEMEIEDNRVKFY